MRYPFKYWFPIFILVMINVFCSPVGYESDPPFITEEQRKLIRIFASENGYPNTIPIDSFVEYLYYSWPNENSIKDFMLTFPAQDSTPKKLLLSDVLTQLGKTLRVHYHDRFTGNIYAAFIDSIEIKTDSVIILPSLDLEHCHLCCLPKEIGNVRVNGLDISNNNFLKIPDELMELANPPIHWDTLIIKYDVRYVNNLEGVSDTLKSWLNKHGADY